ncbi:NAD-P-binding protein [Gautieria morchelliformis]|nr:NAD-P-binding protein [Gautieria morchelliformis]
MGQLWSQTFPPKSTFNVSDIPDLSGKIMIVTGGNSGIGKEIVRALLEHNAKVYMAARNADAAKLAIQELKTDVGKEAHFLQLDLSSLKDIQRAANEFLHNEKELHALYNNAGVMYLTAAAHSMDVTEDGYDIQWGTNVVGPFYFTQLLMPAIVVAAENSPDNARITFTSSSVQTTSIKWDTLTATPARKKMGPDQRYMQSKFANVVMAREFARRYGDRGVVVTSLNPGGIRTELQRHMPGLVRSLLNMILHPAPMGALTPLWAGTSPQTKELNGKYLIPWARIGSPSAAAQDLALGQRLWDYLQDQVKQK